MNDPMYSTVGEWWGEQYPAVKEMDSLIGMSLSGNFLALFGLPQEIHFIPECVNRPMHGRGCPSITQEPQGC